MHKVPKHINIIVVLKKSGKKFRADSWPTIVKLIKRARGSRRTRIPIPILMRPNIFLLEGDLIKISINNPEARAVPSISRGI